MSDSALRKTRTADIWTKIIRLTTERSAPKKWIAGIRCKRNRTVTAYSHAIQETSFTYVT
jgi:hypothetical protein